MTIGEVLAWQDSIDPRYRSEAAGAYQILEDTLRRIYAPAGLKLTDLFNRRNQDRLALFLLRERGLNLYIEGKISAETFANRLAREWASFPLVTGAKRGMSYYGDDGLNKALVSPGRVLSAVRAITASPAPTPPEEAPAPWWAILWAVLAGFFTRKGKG